MMGCLAATTIKFNFRTEAVWFMAWPLGLVLLTLDDAQEIARTIASSKQEYGTCICFYELAQAKMVAYKKMLDRSAFSLPVIRALIAYFIPSGWVLIDFLWQRAQNLFYGFWVQCDV